mmetsp:Transcript_18108/g.54439  ORF Transcript_18108/g.54439 Transcript_18108/m.54439 type:complete len:123 (-) Transcript_18108:84-452(-)
MNTFSAENNPELEVSDTDAVVKKGYHCDVDSYSAFWDNGHIHPTDLQTILDAADIQETYMVGLALDFCVYYSAMDSQQIGYKTSVIVDATRPITGRGGVSAVKNMTAAGISVINSEQFFSQH